MKRALFLLTILLLACLARADDQTLAVQKALKDQGFYYGDVDGQGGPETDAAVRRYQIRQGLDVTGKMDEQTLDSLNLGGHDKDRNTIQAVPPPADDSANSPPPPQPAATPDSVVQSDRDFLRRQQPQAPPPAPASNDDNDAAPVPPPPQSIPPDAGQSLPPDYASFFRKTPYETAPPVVQRSTVQRAQTRLAQEGFYRGIADGELGGALSHALAAYQRYAELRPTGRLDMDTLADMNLLPRRQIALRPPPPYDSYGEAPDGREVYRGIWVH